MDYDDDPLSSSEAADDARRWAAVRDILTDASLTAVEKNAKIQSLMGVLLHDDGSSCDGGEDSEEKVTATTAANNKKNLRVAPPPSMSPHGFSSASREERIARKMAGEGSDTTTGGSCADGRGVSPTDDDAGDRIAEHSAPKVSGGGSMAESSVAAPSYAEVQQSGATSSSNDNFAERLARKAPAGETSQTGASSATVDPRAGQQVQRQARPWRMSQQMARKMREAGYGDRSEQVQSTMEATARRSLRHSQGQEQDSNDEDNDGGAEHQVQSTMEATAQRSLRDAERQEWDSKGGNDKEDDEGSDDQVQSMIEVTVQHSFDPPLANNFNRGMIDELMGEREVSLDLSSADNFNKRIVHGPVGQGGKEKGEGSAFISGGGGKRRQGSGYTRQSWFAMAKASVRAFSPLNDKNAKGEADMSEVGEEELVSACLVEDDDVVEAELMEKQLTVKRAAYYTGIALAVLATIVGLSIGLTRGGDDAMDTSSDGAPPKPAPTYDPRPTLERMKDEGVLKCGIFNLIGFGKSNDTTGKAEGFSVDLCRAVAAAALGSDTYAIQTVYVRASDRWEALANHTLDLLISANTHTMQRDVHEPTTGIGFSFTVPYFYDGLRFGGVPHYVDCADDLDRAGDCSDLQICVLAGTTYYDILSAKLPGYLISELETPSDIARSLVEGSCNVIGGPLFGISPELVRMWGYQGPYKLGTEIFSKEPVAMVTREDDPNFSEFVNVVMQSLISAESDNVTQKNPSSYVNFTFFGKQYENMLVDAISTVGNIGEIYGHNFQGIMTRTAENTINRGESGLIYSHPFGEQNDVPPQALNGTIDNILQRGWLRCGVSMRNILSSLDEDYCRALAAGIFAGDDGAVEFVDVDPDGGRFSALEADEVDVLSGSCIRLKGGNGQQSNSNYTGKGFLYSQPYFYFPTSWRNSSTNYLALATRTDDMQWYGFVYWVVSSTFFAEENMIGQDTFYLMPSVTLFGPDFNWLFRDVISRVGNYGEMYIRNVNESLFPRDGGRNQLNRNPVGPQHFPLEGFRTAISGNSQPQQLSPRKARSGERRQLSKSSSCPTFSEV